MKLYIHVVTVLLEDQSDVQVLEGNRLPSRVVASSPPGPILELMRQTGESVEVQSGSLEDVFAAAKEIISNTVGLMEQHSVSNHPSHWVNSQVKGSLYIRPLGDEVGFGFPICEKYDHELGDDFVPRILEVPPVIEPGQPRVWARYHLALSSEKPQDPIMIPEGEILKARSTPPEAEHHSRDAVAVEGVGGRETKTSVLGWLREISGKGGEGNQDEGLLAQRGFRFTRMVPEAKADSAWIAGLRGLSLSRIAAEMKDQTRIPDSNIPAGYAFFGQFLTHELTHDGTTGLPMNALPEAAKLTQLRSPSFDLDSLYGGDGKRIQAFLKEDGLRMKVSHDLPRRRDGLRGGAVIAEARNDGNLGVAQMHVALLQLHNRIAKHMPPDPNIRSAEQKLKRVQVELRRNVQAVALYDFAKRICSPLIYAQALGDSGRFKPSYWDPQGSNPGMPLEFSAGAFRLGHSLLANEYSWNDFYNQESSIGKLPLAAMMAMTGSGGLEGGDEIPKEYIIDWRRFFDFGEKSSSLVQMTRKIDPYASSSMHALPPQLAAFGSLPKLNLVRGARLLLKPGQVIAERMGVDNVLSASQMQANDPLGKVLKELDFLEQTPLWLYILREAQVQGDGNHLGELGSKIVLDTLGVLIQKTEGSILQSPDWKSIVDGKRPVELQMPDLLAWGHD